MKFLNDLKDFIKNVAQDQRIPERDKKIILAMVALIISPIDLIPDYIPFIGLLDDVILLAIVLDYFFKVLDQEVLLSHYPWGMKSFVRLKKMSQFLSIFVPGFIKKRLWSYVGSPY